MGRLREKVGTRRCGPVGPPYSATLWGIKKKWQPNPPSSSLGCNKEPLNFGCHFPNNWLRSTIDFNVVKARQNGRSTVCRKSFVLIHLSHQIELDECRAVVSHHYVGRTACHIYKWSACQCRTYLGYTRKVQHQMGIFQITTLVHLQGTVHQSMYKSSTTAGDG
jgi:hypothetical protein